LIDLHTHTTASDGRCTPDELVERAAAAGVAVLAVTDHDTVAGCTPASAACARRGLEFVPGIEITAVVDGRDVHVLGYFIDVASPVLLAFLAEQRQRRIDRARAMIEHLSAHGIQLDSEAVLAPALEDPTMSAGRPWIARALMSGGYVASINEAFDRWLDKGKPAFEPRVGAPPEEVFVRIHEAGGLASLAHPGQLKHDEWIPRFVEANLDALEAYHSDHDALAMGHYAALANRLGLAISGGSDYHGDESHGPGGPGSVSLPRDVYEKLKARRQSSC
jgi:predicted metal-dependent phosphoesterase TrpH